MAAEEQVRDPTGQQRGQDRREAIERALALRQIVDVGFQANLADHQGNGLTRDHDAILDQVGLDQISTDRHIRRQRDRGTEQPLTQQCDRATMIAIEPFADTRVDQRAAPFRQQIAGDGTLRAQVQIGSPELQAPALGLVQQAL